MNIEDKKIILNYEDDYEFFKLISHIIKVKYGEIRLKIKHAKPYQIIETQKSILLTKDVEKDSKDYGE